MCQHLSDVLRHKAGQFDEYIRANTCRDNRFSRVDSSTGMPEDEFKVGEFASRRNVQRWQREGCACTRMHNECQTVIDGSLEVELMAHREGIQPVVLRLKFEC